MYVGIKRKQTQLMNCELYRLMNLAWEGSLFADNPNTSISTDKWREMGKIITGVYQGSEQVNNNSGNSKRHDIALIEHTYDR